MNKLILNPTECGYRKSIFTRLGLPFGKECTHKPRSEEYCNQDKEFPTNCPLHDGQPIPKSIEALQNMVQYELKRLKSTEICGKSHKHTYYKNGHRVYPKRNRKDCISCISTHNPNICKINYYTCVGVNCGRFETKEKSPCDTCESPIISMDYCFTCKKKKL